MSDNPINNKHFQPELETVSEFLERFKIQNYKVLKDNKDELDKAMLLANALPVNILTDIQRRLKPAKLSETKYEEIEKHLISLHSTKKSIIGASVAFLNRKQQAGESIECFAKSLNELASQCAYESCCRDRMLRDAFVSGLRNPKLISTLIHEAEEKKFHDLLEKAKIIEQLHLDVADMNPGAKSYNQNAIKKFNNHKKSNNFKGVRNKREQSPKISEKYVCCRCGAAGKHLANNCFALKLKCERCSKFGHLQKCCRTKQYNGKQENGKLNRVNPEEEDPAKYFTMHQVKALDTVRDPAHGNNLFDSRPAEGKQVDNQRSADATLHSTEAPPTHDDMSTIEAPPTLDVMPAATESAAATSTSATCRPPQMTSQCRNTTSPHAYDGLCAFGDAISCCSACMSIDVHDTDRVYVQSAVPVKCHNKFFALSDCTHADSTGDTRNNAPDEPVSSIKVISKNDKSYAGVTKSKNNSFLG